MLRRAAASMILKTGPAGGLARQGLHIDQWAILEAHAERAASKVPLARSQLADRQSARVNGDEPGVSATSQCAFRSKILFKAPALVGWISIVPKRSYQPQGQTLLWLESAVGRSE